MAALASGLMLAALGSAGAQTGAGACAEVRQVEIESREAIGAGRDQGEARERAVRQALVLAVGVVGAPGGVAAPAPALDYRTARGRVVSHEVVAERVDREAAGEVIVVTVRAGVCVPRRGPVKEVIAIGDFLDGSGRPLSGARRQLFNFFATLGRSPRFTLTEAHPSSAPSDIVIAGRILGGGVARSGDRIELRVLIEAHFPRTGQVITSTGDGKKNLKQGLDPRLAVPEALERAIEQAGPRIYTGIEQSPTPPAPAPVAAVPAPAQPAPASPAPPSTATGDLVALFVPRCMEGFRHGVLAAAGTEDANLLEHVSGSVIRCTRQAWNLDAPERMDWVVRNDRDDRRFAGLCDRIDQELFPITAAAPEATPANRLRARVLRLCRFDLPRRLAVNLP